MSGIFRAFCFTLNNYSEEESTQLLSETQFTYVVIGKEVGAEGTPHLQGYAELCKQSRMSLLKKINPRMHVEGRRGTATQAIDYCKKDGDFTERGERRQQGARLDLQEIKKAVLAGANRKELYDMCSNFQQVRVSDHAHKLFAPRRDEPVCVMWFWGASGSGKTTTARSMYPDAPIIRNLRWWQEYEGEKEIIIDEFRSHKCPYDDILGIMDNQPFTVEYKGGTQPLLATTIIITSILPPWEMYPDTHAEPIYQIMRRINFVLEFLFDPKHTPFYNASTCIQETESTSTATCTSTSYPYNQEDFD